MKFWDIFRTKVKIMYSITTKVSSVPAMFINRQGRSYLKSLVMILCFDDTSNCSNLIYCM